MITNETSRSVGALSRTRNVGEPLAGSRKLKDERKRL